MEMSVSETTSEEPRKGRSNAILTYEKLEELTLGIASAQLKLDVLDARMKGFGNNHTDHEIRIRALELTLAGLAASRGTASWAFSAVWPIATVLIAGISLAAHLWGS